MKQTKRSFAPVLALAMALLMSITLLPTTAKAATGTEKEAMAKALFSIGLFKGYDTSGSNFGLSNAPTREQALIFQIRALGEEAAALAYTGTSPYADVSKTNASTAWFVPYASYATAKGYTNGMGGGKFGYGQPATAQMMTTFVLRGMGFADSGSTPDFAYNNAISFGFNRGICETSVAPAKFYRGDAVVILYRALESATKSGTALSSKLISQGLFTQTAFESAKAIAKNTPVPTGAPTTLSSITTGSSQGNVNNYGLAVSDGKYIYYVNRVGGKHIDRMSTTATAPIKLIDADAQCLNVIGDWLYYSNPTAKTINKMKTDGSSHSVIKSGVSATFMQVTSGGQIYFLNRLSTNSEMIYRMKTDGSAMETVADVEAGEFLLFKDYIIIQNKDDGWKLYWINTNDLTLNGKLTDVGAESLGYYNGRILFSDRSKSNKYASVKPNGTDYAQEREWFTGASNVDGNSFFFSGGSDDRSKGKLYVQTFTAAQYDGKLLSGTNTAYNMSVAGNYVFYATKSGATAPLYFVKKDGTGNKIVPAPTGLVDPTSVKLDKTSLSLAVGEKYDLTATLAPANAKIILTWSTSNATIAGVSGSGVVKGNKAGTATITVRTNNGKTATCRVTVTDAGLATITADFVLFNNTGKGIKELYMTTANTDNWGDNLLSGSTELKINGKITLSIPFNKTTIYDLRAVYSGGTEKIFPSFSLAGADATGGFLSLSDKQVNLLPNTLSVAIENLTSKSMPSVMFSYTGSGTWSKNLGTIASKSSITVGFSVQKLSDGVDLRVSFNGMTHEFEKVNLGALPVTGARLYLFEENGKLTISDKAPAAPEPVTNKTVHIYNSTGKTIQSIQSSSSQLTSWGTNLLSGNLAVDQTAAFIVPVSASDSKFDLKITYSDGSGAEFTGYDFKNFTSGATLYAYEEKGTPQLSLTKPVVAPPAPVSHTVTVTIENKTTLNFTKLTSNVTGSTNLLTGLNGASSVELIFTVTPESTLFALTFTDDKGAEFTGTLDFVGTKDGDAKTLTLTTDADGSLQW